MPFMYSSLEIFLTSELCSVTALPVLSSLNLTALPDVSMFSV
jgi:hypothetical protein